MDPRKLPQAIKSPPVKKKKGVAEKSQNFQETPETDSADDHDTYLSLLPSEILLCIFSFLSPADLSSLSELKNKRLTDLTYSLREANVSSCRRTNPLLISAFFNRIRVKYIQKINFNYYFYIEPHELANLICLCENLAILSVVECGLKYNNIIHILQSCTNLEELSWNIQEVERCLEIRCSKMKRVYLFCDISYNTAYCDTAVSSVIRNFPKIENVWINMAPNFISALPFVGPWLSTLCVSSNRLAKHFALTINSIERISVECAVAFLLETMREFCETNDIDYMRRIAGEDVRNRVCNSPPYLQIESRDEDIALLSAGPFNTYSTVEIILTKGFLTVSESLIKCIKDIAGDKLIHLSFHTEGECLGAADNLVPLADEEAIAICHMLDEMFLTSKNITVLNLTTIHFNKGSPIKAITQLPHLKVLNIPSCAFGSSAKLAAFQSFELSNVVSSCPKVVDFALNCCVDDSHQLSEDDIVCIKDWSQLKHLSIYSIVFQTCNFLKKVANSCVDLQSLSLISVARKKKCLFTEDVIYVLKKAQNLKFIRINEEKFDPMYEGFWDAIGEAVNLEGICMITQSKGPVDEQTIIKGIKNLKYLHLFHFYAPRATDLLYSEAKRSMQEHDIKNIRIENFCKYDLFSGQDFYVCYHQKPHFCCQLLHLKNIDIF